MMSGKELAGSYPRDHLQMFLYVVMRDHMSFGKLEEIIEDLEKLPAAAAKTVNFSEPLMGAYAKKLADKLRSLAPSSEPSR